MPSCKAISLSRFLSTLSLRRATYSSKSLLPLDKISIHALLAESDYQYADDVTDSANFYPRSPCGERHRLAHGLVVFVDISIHALLAESDCSNRYKDCRLSNFYPRSPCGERQRAKCLIAKCQLFLSTLSLRRATRTHFARISAADNFYPRSPCGERHCPTSCRLGYLTPISIHALLAESDRIR